MGVVYSAVAAGVTQTPGTTLHENIQGKKKKSSFKTTQDSLKSNPSRRFFWGVPLLLSSRRV